MDQRTVFNNSDELLAIVEDLQVQKQHASLLVDSEGLSRMEGLIANIEYVENNPDALITMDSGFRLQLKNIVAVNGIFHANYTEC